MIPSLVYDDLKAYNEDISTQSQAPNTTSRLQECPEKTDSWVY